MANNVGNQPESSDPLSAAWAVDPIPVETEEERLAQLVNYLEDHVEAYNSLSAPPPWGKAVSEVSELRRQANIRGSRMPDSIVHSSILVLGSGVNHTLPYVAYAQNKVKNRDQIVDDVSVRIFTPTNPTGAVVVAAHGGAFWMGNGELRDNAFGPTCAALAQRSGAVVIDVDYRLAPEHPMPAAAEDIAAVARAVASGELDISLDLGGPQVGPLVLFGNSSGGHAVVNSLKFLASGTDVALLLDKPALDLRGAPAIMIKGIFGFEDSSDPLVSPILGSVPEGLRVHIQSAVKDGVVAPADEYLAKVQAAGGKATTSAYMATHLVAEPTVQRRQITDAAKFILEVTGTVRVLPADAEGEYDKEAVDRENEESWKR